MSCSTHRIANDTVSGQAIPAVAKQRTAAADFATLQQCNTDWQSVKIPIKLKLKSPKEISISGTLTMTRNSAIQISLRMLGFEVGALTVTSDSIVAYEKLNKRYVSESLTRLLAGFPATVGNVQALLLGKLFAPGEDATPLADGVNASFVAPATDKDDWQLMPDMSVRGLTCSFDVKAGDRPILLSFNGTAGSKPFSVRYSDVVNDTYGGQCATVIDLEAKTAESTISGQIEMNLKKAKWNTGEKISLKIPKGYRPINGESLIKMLNNL